DYKQEQCFLSSLPVLSIDADIERKSRRNVLTDSLAASFPFSSFEIYDEGGIFLGLNKYNRSVAILDIFDSDKYANTNGCIYGTTGAGKTFLLQNMALRFRMQGTQVFIIAPVKGHEYIDACEAIGGKYIKIAPSSKDCINIMEIRKTSISTDYEIKKDTRNDSILAEKMQSLMIFFSLIKNDIKQDELNLLDRKGKYDERLSDYVGLREDCGLNKHIIVYGATGAGKSRGFVKPYILKMVQMMKSGQKPQSMIIVDPKAELFEQYSQYLSENGYEVKALNLLDMENSDGWNCIGETEGDVDMVQSVAEIIIRNTSDAEKADFWDKAEQNLLIALILYVQSMKDPITNELLPLHERSLGTIYKILSSESAKSLDVKFQRLPLDHPARGPYGIFKQAASNLWGNVFIGLGSRMSVFQNSLVDKITKYHDIDLELPGKKPCAYFCIISAQDTAYEFLSSLFFSMLFKKLSDYARKHGDERGRLPVEVNFMMDEFCNVGKLLDFKKTISVVRGYGINCQIIVQSIAQLSDRYPIKEWEEIVGNCDTQLVLGCNDMMTSDYISKRCGSVTISLANSMTPQTPLFSPVSREITGYRVTKSNNTRPLMYPEEILQMDNKECLLLIRGQKPLKAYKVIPDELSSYKELKYTRVTDYLPKWRQQEETTTADKAEKKQTEAENYQTNLFNETNSEGNTVSTSENEKREEIQTEATPSIDIDGIDSTVHERTTNGENEETTAEDIIND
ncbi:MAG: type IV secretory system conjugative DNA transfer family protein, partial [Clostridia bacterium]|nr:type IV secretory system conjugative DNA transfer family protein [Clostridia bacterium]